MNSSDDDELPEIPGTRFPWMSLEKESEAGPSNRIERYKTKMSSSILYIFFSSSSDDELPDIPGTKFPWMKSDDEKNDDEVATNVAER